MNILDIIIVILIAGAVWSGLHRGFVLQAARLAGLILALVVAFLFSRPVAEGLRQLLPFSGSGTDSGSLMSLLPVDVVLYRIIAFALLFFGTRLVVRLVAGMLNQVATLPVLNSVNRLAGVLLALLQISIILFIVVNIMQFIPGPKMQSFLQQSWIASWMLNQTPIFTKWLENWLNAPKT